MIPLDIMKNSALFSLPAYKLNFLGANLLKQGIIRGHGGVEGYRYAPPEG